MYPQDIKEFTASRLVAHIAKALNTGAPLELRPLYEELELHPSGIAAYHAAAAAVHVLLAHTAGQAMAEDPLQRPSQLESGGAGGGAGPKALAGAAPAHARRLLKRRAKAKPAKSSSTRTSKPRKERVTLKCEVCGRPFLTQGRLTNHLRDQHGSEWAPAPSSATAESAA